MEYNDTEMVSVPIRNEFLVQKIISGISIYNIIPC